MRQVIGTLVGFAVLSAGGLAAFMYTGIYDIGADDKHWPLTYQIMETARLHSIKVHAAGVNAPANLHDQHRILVGAVHFATHCAVCHSAPGVEAEDLAEGMYPKPPQLTHVAERWTPGELFWIVKHGVKMSGMPSWADHGDDELWNSVAFLQKLPELTPDDYKKLLQTAKAEGVKHDMGDVKGGHEDKHAPAPKSTRSAPGGSD